MVEQEIRGGFALALDAFAAAGGAPFIAHADEFETSLYLHLAPERVRMDRAVAVERVERIEDADERETPLARL